MTVSHFEIMDGYKLRKKVRAVIMNERGEYLLIQPHSYAPDGWTLVGGGVEEGEDDRQAILREMREETGIAEVQALHMSEAVHQFCFSAEIKRTRNYDYDGQVARVFWVAVPADTVIRLQESEVLASCWAAPDKAEGLIKVPEQKALFKEVLHEFRDLSETHKRNGSPPAIL